jgi:glyoxylase-like metal-dependent hydrolase (beta-lactamase superfamily II)
MAKRVKQLQSEFTEIEGIIRFKGPIPTNLRFTCMYLFEIDNMSVAFDAGINFPDFSQKFFASVKKLPDYCIISHSHPDHIGLIKKLKQKNPNMQLLMSELTHDIIKWHSNPKNAQAIQDTTKSLIKEVGKYGLTDKQATRVGQYLTAWPKLIKYEKPDVVLRDGDEVSIGTKNLKIISTPGHTVGHICVLDKEKRCLFSGDHVLSKITPHIGTFDVYPEFDERIDFSNPLRSYLESLEKIDRLNVKITFPAHQDIIYNLHERVAEIKQHHKNRLHEIQEIIKERPISPLEISHIHFGEDMDEFNYLLALNETASHLIYLEEQDKIKRIQKNGKILFKS